jgi:hypothetical protein
MLKPPVNYLQRSEHIMHGFDILKSCFEFVWSFSYLQGMFLINPEPSVMPTINAQLWINWVIKSNGSAVCGFLPYPTSPQTRPITADKSYSLVLNWRKQKNWRS